MSATVWRELFLQKNNEVQFLSFFMYRADKSPGTSGNTPGGELPSQTGEAIIAQMFGFGEWKFKAIPAGER